MSAQLKGHWLDNSWITPRSHLNFPFTLKLCQYLLTLAFLLLFFGEWPKLKIPAAADEFFG